MITISYRKNLVGKKFGRLTVVDNAKPSINSSGRIRRKVLCSCDCGNTKIVYVDNLTGGKTISCGCVQKERAKQARTIHGDTDSRLYNIWSAIKRRCYKEYDKTYKHYGGRGINMCDDWKNDYDSFRKWSLENGYDYSASRGECTIDRIDPNGNYEPSNCRWVNMSVQGSNKRTTKKYIYKGEEHSISEWAKITGIDYYTLYQRLNRYGYSIEEALQK